MGSSQVAGNYLVQGRARLACNLDRYGNARRVRAVRACPENKILGKLMILGIDTARGWAVGYPGEWIVAAGTVQGLQEMIEQITELVDVYDFSRVLIEKAPRRTLYARHAKHSHRVQLNISAKVGENRAQADALFYYCKGLGLDPVFVSPVKNGTKLSAEQVERLTGWQGRTSEHARDAIVICWLAPKGRNAENQLAGT